MQHYRKKLVVLALSLLPATGWAGASDEIKDLFEQGKAFDAYRIGKTYPDELGNPSFDFYFGMAAIDAGHASEGILALERYLLSFPENDRARLELARGYFVLGEDARARDELESVRAKNPPPSVVATIDRYLEAIRIREGRYQTTARLYLEAGLGMDSNVNGGVGSANIRLPVLGDVTVSGTGTRTGDSFTHVSAGGQIIHPVAPGFSIFGGAEFETKQHHHDTAFDQDSLSLAGGASYVKDENFYRATLSHSTTRVENDRYRAVLGLAGEWHHQLDELHGTNVFAQYAELEYVGNNQVRDANLLALGVGFRKVFVAPWQPMLNISFSFTDEDNARKRPDLGRHIYGLRAVLNTSPSPQWGINLGFSYQDNRYGAPDPILNTIRYDQYHSLDLSAIYLLDKNWSLKGELLLASNNSNLSLYEYRREMAAIKLRYEFK